MSALFKFIGNIDALPFLLKGSIKFTPIPELNDPTELSPKVVGEEVVQSLRRLRQNGYSNNDIKHLRRQGAVLQRLAPEFQAVPVPRTKEEANKLIHAPFFDDFPVLERLLEQTAKEMSAKVGLFCLTKRNEALPMWAHYAANATGMVVEFLDLHDSFKGDDTGVLAQPLPVRYDRERLGVTLDPRSHDSIFFSKFADWRYEKESRIVLPLSECRPVEAGNQRLYLFDISPRHVSRIILGWRMPENVVEQAVEIVRSIKPNTEIVHAKIEKGRVCGSKLLYP